MHAGEETAETASGVRALSLTVTATSDDVTGSPFRWAVLCTVPEDWRCANIPTLPTTTTSTAPFTSSVASLPSSIMPLTPSTNLTLPVLMRLVQVEVIPDAICPALAEEDTWNLTSNRRM